MSHRTSKLVVPVTLLWMMSMIAFGGNAQTAATLGQPDDTIEATAGDSVEFIAKFDLATTCVQLARVYLGRDTSTPAIFFDANLAVGQRTATFRTAIPRDAAAGKYKIVEATLFPCAGYSQQKHFAVSGLTLNVAALPDPNSYPAKALAAWTPNQQQFLATKISELSNLVSEVDTRVERNGADTSELRSFLASVVSSAVSSLGKTRSQYQEELLKANEPLPAFFADFDKQYADLLVEIRAPIPAMQRATAATDRLLLVQLQKRSPPTGRPTGRNLSGTAPAIANGAKRVIEDNGAAYTILKTTGRATFRARFSSKPSGATLFYRQAILPEFKQWSTPTDIPETEFELATFIFKFHRDDCKDEPVRTIDPYDDTEPNVSVEFHRCSK